MSLGPAGASLNPEEAENFEDVSGIMSISGLDADGSKDGETICRQRSALELKRWVAIL